MRETTEPHVRSSLSVTSVLSASDTGECVRCVQWFLSLREQLSWLTHPEIISASCRRLDGSDRSPQRTTH